MATQLPFDDISVESQAIDRRRQMAQALMQTGAPQGRMVGRVFVGANPLEYLANGLKQYAGRKDLEQADVDQRALGQQATARNASQVQQYVNLLRGKEAQPGFQTGGNEMGDEPAMQAETPAQPANPNAALAMALQSQGNPMLQQLAAGQVKQMTAGPVVVGRSLVNPSTGKVVGTDATWEAEQKAAREQKQAELTAKLEDARASREERAAAQKELAQMRLDGQKELRAMTTAVAGAGKVPAGYRPTADGNLQAIPGGPADLKLQGALNQDTQALNGGLSSFDRLATAANEVLNHPGLKGITGVQGKIPNLPGGQAANAEALLGTLKSQVGFGVLQDMRNNSKTGGALGSVSDAEGKRLEANLAALDKSQSLEQFQTNLKKIVDYAEGAKGRLREAYNMKHANASPAAAPVSSSNDPLGLRGGK